MSAGPTSKFDYLLNASIRWLEDLKSQGHPYVTVDQNLLTRLRRPPLTPPSQPQIPPATPKECVETRNQNPVTSPTPTTTPEIESLNDLKVRALSCSKCPHLVRTRKNVVFGVGNPEADLMFVGEAPGADEDTQGEPFVGKAGQLLTKIIGAMGLSRDDVYIANILKCRPDNPGKAYGNRRPTLEEMRTCIPYLHAQIDLLSPKALIALGGVALEGLLGESSGITRARGNWQTFRGIPLMPTYHPAYLLRNQSFTEKRKVWEDMLQVMEKLKIPISAKQRGYFLTGKS